MMLGIIVQYTSGNFDSTEQAVARQFLQQEGRVFVIHGEHSGWNPQNHEIMTFLESIMSGSDFSYTGGSMQQFNFTYGGITFENPSTTNASSSSLNCPANLNTYCYGTWAFFPASMTDSEYVSDVIVWLDVDGVVWDLVINNSITHAVTIDILQYAQTLSSGSDTSSTYNLFEDQVTLAGRVYTDAMLTNYYTATAMVLSGVFAFAVIPIENFAASGTTNDYFYPNFIPTNLWSYGDLGLHYCAGIISNDQCTSYEENYEWSSYALDHNQNIWTNRLNAGANYVPEGQSLWWQVLNPMVGELAWVFGHRFPSKTLTMERPAAPPAMIKKVY